MKKISKFFEKMALSDAALTLEERGYVPFDLRLSDREKEILKNLHVGATAQYDNFGGTQKDKRSQLKEFFHHISRDKSIVEDMTKIVLSIQQNITTGFSSRYSWLSLRAYQPTPLFNMPRWHQDGLFYDSQEDQFKAAISLKGNPTLFINAQKSLREEFSQCAARVACSNPAEIRPIMNAFIQDRAADSMQSHRSVIFNVGRQDAAIHSEPPIQQDRIFMSVLPGSKKQIEQLRQRWGAPVSEIKRGLM